MEAENYLAAGYGIRLAIEAQPSGWTRFSGLARPWQPSRLKGIQVSPAHGAPFLAATQVLDLRPVPRKWLAPERTQNFAQRFVTPGTILVTCSGSVGRATLAHSAHEGLLISHDLLRVTPNVETDWGWIYAFLRSPQGRAMMVSTRYGHMIKHLEVGHLNSLPIPMPRADIRADLQSQVAEVLRLRSRSFELTEEAFGIYAGNFPARQRNSDSLDGFVVSSSLFMDRRRRLDASVYDPLADEVEAALRTRPTEPLSDVTSGIFVPGRFKHVYGDGGTPYLDSADILEVGPDITKYVLAMEPEKQEKYRVGAHWLLMPCSGQVYGNLGQTVLSTAWHTGKLLSNHIMRICPNRRIRSGYLQCVLGHPTLGRPLITRFAFGSSVPEIAPGDLYQLPVPRLDDATEAELAHLMDEAAVARDTAEQVERQLAADAETLIDLFLEGDADHFLRS